MDAGEEVQILRPDEQARAKLDAMLSVEPIAPVLITQGKISRETLTDIAQENVGLAFNRITSIAQNGDDKIALQAAREVLDRAHGKVANDAAQVNVQVNMYSITNILKEIEGESAVVIGDDVA